MRRALVAAGVVLLLTPLPSPARADVGELMLGGGPTLRWPAAAAGEAGARLGVGDFLALDARVGGGGARAGGGFGYGEVGAVALLDVLTWVPELRGAVGAQAQRTEVAPLVHATLGLRRYWSADLSAAIELGGLWTPGEWRGTLALTAWLALF